MKNITCITFFVVLLIINNAFGQCDNNMSTDPTNPTNSALPDDSTSSIPYSLDERFLNGLDWVDRGARNHDIFHFFKNKVKI